MEIYGSVDCCILWAELLTVADSREFKFLLNVY